MAVTKHDESLPAQASSVGEVIATAELSKRPPRAADFESENRALRRLVATLAQSPHNVLQEIAQSALELTGADSSGVSIAEVEDGKEIFRWRATAGEFSRYLQGTMPRRFSPCGTVLETASTLLMLEPARYFPYIGELHAPIREVLLVPFARGKEPIGTVWVIAHTEGCKFDSEDRRVVESLAGFASMATKNLDDLEALRVSGNQLSAANARLDSAIEAGAIGVWSADAGGECVADNYVLSLFGLPPRPHGIVGLPELMQAVHPDDLGRALAENKAAMRTGEPYESEFRTLMPDGTVKWVAVRARATAAPTQNATRFHGIVMDVTTRMTAKLTEQESTRRLTEFIATLAHELRNPLAPIRNGISLLAKQSLGPAGDKARSIMGRQVELMARLIDDLMDVARITSGKVHLQPERTDLGNVVRRAIETSSPQIEEGRHTLTLSLPAQALVVEGDPIRLAQVFSNLLTNASRYTPAGGALAVSIAAEGPWALVRVTDNGIGIEADKLSAVFEMFAQAGSPQERRGAGLGIGLSLARSLVQLHGGTLHAESGGSGKGSTFVVRLPLVTPPVL